MIVKESIEFKRGVDPKDSLRIGIKELNTDPDTLEKNLDNDNDLLEKGLTAPTVYKWSGRPDSIMLSITQYDHLKNFKNDTRVLTDYMNDWLNKNTYYIIHELDLAKGTTQKEGKPIFIVEIELKDIRE